MANPVIIYAYRMTSDSGTAPCVHDLAGEPTDILTLACCKGGQIRNDKGIKTGLRHTIGKVHREAIANGQVDVYLMGIYKNSLLYFAKITGVMPMEEYFAPGSPYKNRKDHIYKFTHGKFRRNGNNPHFHPKNELSQHKRDWLGEFVLVSNCFAYWGKNSKRLPKDLLEILPKHQESKSYKNDSSEGKRIMAAVRGEFNWNFKDNIQCVPHNPGKTRHCIKCGTR